MFIIDLGCNVGETIKQFFNDYPYAQILGIDFDKRSFEQAQGNLKGYEKCILVNKAVGWPERDIVGWLDSSPEVSTIIPIQMERLNVEAFPVDVHVYTLDSILEDLKLTGEIIDILKIDIQGAEEELLEGGGYWVARTNTIYLECHTQQLIQDCTDMLLNYGFSVRPKTALYQDQNHLVAQRV